MRFIVEKRVYLKCKIPPPPAYMKGWTNVRCTTYRRFSQNQNFLDASVYQIFLLMVLRCTCFVCESSAKINRILSLIFMTDRSLI